MDHFGYLPQLEYLDLQDNQISNLDPLSACHKLKHLDVSLNRLSHLPNLAHCTGLQVMMLSVNQIKSLETAPDFLPALLKVLAIDRNQVSALNELRYLSASTELKTLSVMGNPMCARAAAAGVMDVRPFAKFVVPPLKVLDGASISEQDRSLSKMLFVDGSGAITEQQLEILDHEAALLQYLSRALSSGSGATPAQAACNQPHYMQQPAGQGFVHQNVGFSQPTTLLPPQSVPAVQYAYMQVCSAIRVVH